MPLPFSALLDSIFIIAGHTGARYEFRDSRGDDGGGIGVVPIVAVLILALVTVGLLVGLDRPERLKSLAPVAFIVVIIAAPLIVWTASSGSDEKGLIVERWSGVTGAPELVVSIAGDDVNTSETTNGKRTVRLECLGRDGQVVLGSKRRWPFADEPGFAYPHVHQKATSEQLQQADRCRLRGTHVRLEAEVTGPLRPGRG